MRKPIAWLVRFVVLAQVVSCGGGAGKTAAGPTGDAGSDVVAVADALENADLPMPSDIAELEPLVSPDAGLEPDAPPILPFAPCPGTPPSAGAACWQSNACFYEDCSKDGRTRAACVDGVWDIQTASCGRNPCHSDSGNFDRNCMAGQMCVQQVSGIVMPECYDNPCAGKASELTTCLAGQYPGCSIDVSLDVGATIRCTASRCRTEVCQ